MTSDVMVGVGERATPTAGALARLSPKWFRSAAQLAGSQSVFSRMNVLI